MASNPPLGYQTKLIPESRAETYQAQVADKAVTITKSAIQGFIESFLSPAGYNRSYLGAAISPEGLQYVTDLTFDEEMKSDPNKRKTYLARFFAENTGRLPSVLIIDQGLEDGDTGINSIAQGISFRSRWRGKVAYIAKVSLSILVATYSEEDTSTLSGLLFYIFDALADVINSRLIRQPNSKWEVRLPLSGITAGQITNVSVEGDVKSQIWTRSVEIICDFETITEFTAPEALFVLPAIGMVASVPGGPLPQVLNLQPNQSLSLGLPYPLLISNMTLRHRLGTSNPNVALASAEPPWFLYPRRQGSAVLYIFDSALTPAEDNPNKPGPDVVVNIPFKITI